MKSLKWWLVWLVCVLLYLPARMLAWALRPMHRPGPWQPRARGRGVWLVCLAVACIAGCTSAAAAGGIAKLLATWDVLCPAGREVILAAAAVARPDDADASAPGARDASTSADNDGGDR